MRPLKIAVIGTNIGSTLHVRPLQIAGFEVAAMVGRDAARTAERARHFGIPVASTKLEAVLDSDVDAVVIATPPELHHPMALAAIGAGKHVLCEKPLALCSAQGEEMRDAARAAGVVAVLQHQLRFRRTNGWLRRMVARGALGDLIQGAFEFEVPMMQRKLVDVPGWWLRPETGGGWLRNYNTHGIDVIRYMLGEFAAVSGRLHADPARGLLADDSYVTNFVLCNGMQGAMLGSCRTWRPHVQSRVIGALASAVIEADARDLTERLFMADESGYRPVEVPDDFMAESAARDAGGLPDMGEGVYARIHAREAVSAEQVALCRAFRRRIEEAGYSNEALASFEDGVAGLRVIEAVERAARERRWVDLA